MDQAEVDQAFTDGDVVNEAFRFVECRFNGTPCWECNRRSTIASISEGVVVVSCEGCGGATLIGPLARFWSPGAASPVRARYRR